MATRWDGSPTAEPRHSLTSSRTALRMGFGANLRVLGVDQAILLGVGRRGLRVLGGG